MPAATNYNNISPTRTLSGAIGTGDTVLTLSATVTDFPSAPFNIRITDATDATRFEVCRATAKAGSTLTVTRAYDGTTAKTFSAGATVEHVVIAQDFDDVPYADGANTWSATQTFSGAATFSNATGVTTDTLTERQAGAGITADGTQLKDGGVTATGNITTTGSVGVGTASPTGSLDINPSSGDSDLRVRDSSGRAIQITARNLAAADTTKPFIATGGAAGGSLGLFTGTAAGDDIFLGSINQVRFTSQDRTKDYVAVTTGGTGEGQLELTEVAGVAEAATLLFLEKGTAPAVPTSGSQVKAYMKADKFIFQYNDGGTTRYKYLDLTGTGVTWTHTTVAP
jgi:hypothetical protein